MLDDSDGMIDTILCYNPPRQERTMVGTRVIASRFRPDYSGFLKKHQWRSALRDFMNEPDSETYVACTESLDKIEVNRVSDIKQVKRLNESDFCIRVMTSAIQCELRYAELMDSQGRPIDLCVESTWRVADPPTFIAEFAIGRLQTGNTISATSLEATLAERCRESITEQVAKYTYEQLKTTLDLPQRFWHAELTDRAAFPGLTLVEVSQARFGSATIDRAKEIQRRKELLDLEEAASKEDSERQKRIAEERGALRQKLREIESAEELSERERQIQVEELEQRREQQALDHQEEMKIKRLEGEKRKLELEASIERLRNRTESAEDILRQAQESERRMQEIREVTDCAREDIAQATSFLKEAIQQGLAVNPLLRFSLGGMSSQTMTLLGDTDVRLCLAQFLREKAGASPDALIMRKKEILTRDVLARKVATLPRESLLQFSFLSQRAGYATVLNLGTSGKVWLHVPNVYVSVENAKVKRDTQYSVPGPELLPLEDGRFYMQDGTPGMEVLTVIVSDEPLVTDNDLFSATEEFLFVDFTPERVDRLLEHLSEMHDDSWDVGILSLLVQ